MGYRQAIALLLVLVLGPLVPPSGTAHAHGGAYRGPTGGLAPAGRAV